MWKISVQIVDQVSQKNPRRSVGKIQYQYHRRSHSDRIRFLKGLLEKLGNLLWDFLQKLCEKKTDFAESDRIKYTNTSVKQIVLTSVKTRST